MFSERQLKILSYIISEKDWVNGSQLAQYLDISSKTVQKEIKNINEILGSKGNIQSNNQKGYCLLKLDDEIKNMVISGDDKQIDTEGIYGRSKLIMALLIFERDYISMGKIADRLYISKSTVNTEMIKVKRVINRTPGCYLEISPVKGIFLHADENAKRIMLTKVLEAKINYAEVLQDPVFNHIDEMYHTAHSFLKNIFIIHDYIVTGAAFQRFEAYIIISILRSKLGFYMEIQEQNTELNKIVLQIADKVHEHFNYFFTKDELSAIQSHLQEINLLKKKVMNSLEIQEKVELFCEKVKRDLGIELIRSSKIFDMFIYHLEQMFIRIHNGHSNINHYTKEIIQKYPLETHLAKTYLQSSFGMEIPESEIGYLIVYLAGAIENSSRKISVLLISDYDASFLFNAQQIISSRLGQALDKIDIIPLYLYESKKEEYILQYDILITTEKGVIFQDREFMYIDSILDKQEIKDMAERIYRFCEERQRRNLEELQKKFVLPEHVVFSKVPREYIEDVLGEFNIVLNENTCFNTLNENTLFISMFALEEGKSEIWKVSMDYGIEYRGKSISQIIFVKYGRGEEQASDFYDMVAEMLKPRAFDLVRKRR